MIPSFAPSSGLAPVLAVALAPSDAALLDYLLHRIADHLPCEARAVVSYDRESKHAGWAAVANVAADGETLLLLRRTRDLLAAIKPLGTPARDPIRLELDGERWQAALAFPLVMPDQVIGLLVLLAAAPDAFDLVLAEADRLAPILPLVDMAGKILENDRLHNLRAQNMATAQSILVTAQAIAENPSPQNVVDILHEALFDTHISSCALLLYEPQRADNPFGPFEYLEVVGTWSRRVGSGVGTGVKLYLKDYPDLLEQLDQQRVLNFPNARGLRRSFDPLVRGFLRAERIRSMTLIALRSSQHNLGVIMIATDQRHLFNERELRSYRTVSEFLAISAMAQMLRQQHDRVQQGRAALLDAVSDGVVMTLPGGRGGMVLTLNQRFTRMFEVAESSAQGLSFDALIDLMRLPEDVRADLQAAWLSAPVSAPTTQHGEFRVMGDDGKPLEIEWYSAPVYQDENVLGRIAIFHDVTAERTAARVRAAFLSRISHELRTPLTSISGFAEFILESYSAQLPDMARDYTEIILAKARHLKHIFDDMIELSRADAGELRLHKTDAHLPDIIIDAVAGMDTHFRKRKQRPVMDIDDDLPPVFVDVDRIIQVLTNLLSNANKYAPEKGTILIATTRIDRAADLPPTAPPDVTLPAILITIADSGKGLTPDEATQVFAPFYRTDDAKKNKIEGTGLGLAVTRGIVEMHRGRIWAAPAQADDQRKENGAHGGLFMFTLPYSPDALRDNGEG
ncbi:MAG: ATP-binding protein [Chloroflexota bacterium]|nr:ATP-binding protein [Chloroflexota bacterium]